MAAEGLALLVDSERDKCPGHMCKPGKPSQDRGLSTSNIIKGKRESQPCIKQAVRTMCVCVCERERVREREMEREKE
jgi:hypothetical protein